MNNLRFLLGFLFGSIVTVSVTLGIKYLDKSSSDLSRYSQFKDSKGTSVIVIGFNPNLDTSKNFSGSNLGLVPLSAEDNNWSERNYFIFKDKDQAIMARNQVINAMTGEANK